MSRFDSELIFEAYRGKAEVKPLEESISVLLKHDIILATDIYNEITMSDVFSGAKKAVASVGNVGNFLMKKVGDYIIQPLLNKVPKLKDTIQSLINNKDEESAKAELQRRIREEGEKWADQILSQVEKRKGLNKESFQNFWDLILLEAKGGIDEALKSSIIELGNSLGDGGADVLADLADGTISLEEVEGNSNLKRICKFVSKLIEDDDERVVEISKLATILKGISKELSPDDTEFSGKYGDALNKILSNKYFKSNDEETIGKSILGGSTDDKTDSKGSSNEDITDKKQSISSKPKLPTTLTVSKISKQPKSVAALQSIQAVATRMPTKPADVEVITNLIDKPNSIKNPEARKALENCIKKVGAEGVKNLVKTASAISTGILPPPSLILLDILIQSTGTVLISLSKKGLKKANKTEKMAFEKLKTFARSFNNLQGFKKFFKEIKTKKYKNQKFQSYVNALVSGDYKQFVDVIEKMGEFVLSKKKEATTATSTPSTSLIIPEKKFEMKDISALFKVMDSFVQKFSPFVKEINSAFNKSQLSLQNTEKVDSSKELSIKDDSQLLDVLNNPNSSLEQIVSAIEYISPEMLGGVEMEDKVLRLKKLIEKIKSNPKSNQIKEFLLKKGISKNYLDPLTKKLIDLATTEVVDSKDGKSEASKEEAKDFDYKDLLKMINNKYNDPKLVADIANSIKDAEARIKQAKDEQERKENIKKLREFLIKFGFATEADVDIKIKALSQDNDESKVTPSEAKAETAASSGGGDIKSRINSIGSQSFFKILYDIIMDRNQMISMAAGMGILFICFALFGPAFLGLIYLAAKAKETSQPEREEKEEKEEQPSVFDNIKSAAKNAYNIAKDNVKAAASKFTDTTPSKPDTTPSKPDTTPSKPDTTSPKRGWDY